MTTIYTLSDIRIAFTNETAAKDALAVFNTEGRNASIIELPLLEAAPKRVQKWSAYRQHDLIRISQYTFWETDQMEGGWYDSEEEAIAALYSDAARSRPLSELKK